MSEIIMKRIDMHQEKIEGLRESISELEKNQSNVAIMIEHLSKSIESMSSSINGVTNEIKILNSHVIPMKQNLESQKTFKKFLIENIINLKIPVFIGAVIFSVHWVNERLIELEYKASPSQAVEIKLLKNELIKLRKENGKDNS